MIESDALHVSNQGGQIAYTGEIDILRISVSAGGGTVDATCQVYDGLDATGELMFACTLKFRRHVVLGIPGACFHFSTGIYVVLSGTGSRCFLWQNGSGHVDVAF